MRFTSRTGQGKPAIGFKFHHQLPQCDFQRSGIRIITHQQVSNVQRRFIQRATVTDSGLTKTMASPVLY